MVQADYPGAEAHFLPADRFGYPGNNGHVAIVIHKTGGDPTPESVKQNFLNSGHSVHYAIGQDGQVWQFVLESSGAGGNCCTEPGYDPFWDQYLHKFRDLNLCTLSIEHCDPREDNQTPLTPKQKEASFKLVAHLVKRYRIPVSHIMTHASIDPINRARCPGNYPMDELRQFIQAGGFSMGVPAGWRDDGTTLVAPNGVHITHGFRDWVLSHDWDEDNWPLDPEFGTQQLEASNPGLGGGTQMMFRWTMLGFTQHGGVFQEWIGQELLHARQRIATLSAQVHG